MKPLKPILKASSWLLGLGALVVSSAGSADAMSVAPPQDAVNTWNDVRRELGENRKPEQFSAPLTQVLERLEDTNDYRRILSLSYTIAGQAELDALDDFWMRYMTARREEAGMLSMLSIRSQVLGSQNMDRETYLKDWLHLAMGGNYECGGNCGNGKGNGGGNGTGNQGGGN